MSVRVDGLPVAPERDALAAAFPDATPRLVVFVHGLMGDELGWRLGRRQGREPYGTRLARDLGCTPVYVRYNTGRHISENGRSLADLLEAVVAAWPVEVAEVALVGHSMGGLVSRSACYHAAPRTARPGSQHVAPRRSRSARRTWARRSSRPSTSRATRRHALPETRMFSTFLRRRSSGIRDLRQGSLVDEDWRDRDPEALRAAACEEVPLLEGATHCFVSATVTRSPRHPVGRVVGDTLVLAAERRRAAAARASSGSRTSTGSTLGATNHIALLNHPAVYEKLREWLR